MHLALFPSIPKKPFFAVFWKIPFSFGRGGGWAHILQLSLSHFFSRQKKQLSRSKYGSKVVLKFIVLKTIRRKNKTASFEHFLHFQKATFPPCLAEIVLLVFSLQLELGSPLQCINVDQFRGGISRIPRRFSLFKSCQNVVIFLYISFPFTGFFLTTTWIGNFFCTFGYFWAKNVQLF